MSKTPSAELLAVAALFLAGACGRTEALVEAVSVPACAGAANAAWPQTPAVTADAQVTRAHGGGTFVLMTTAGGATVVKLDDRGQASWMTVLDGYSSAVAGSPAGEALVATGVTGPPVDPMIRLGGRGRAQMKITKLDGAGAVLWQALVADETGDLGAQFIATTSRGDVIVGGSLTPDMPPSDFPNPPSREGGFLAKVASNGQVSWERHFGDPGGVRGFAVDETDRPGATIWTDTTIAIDGVTLSPPQFGRAGFFVTFDDAGRAVEAHDVTVDAEERFEGAAIDGQGRLFISGWIGHDGRSFTSEIVVSAFERSGAQVWTQRFSLTDQSDGSGVALDECGDLLLIGNGQGTANGFLAARLSRDGVVKARVVVPSPEWRRAADLAPAPGGLIVTGGTGSGERGFLSFVPL